MNSAPGLTAQKTSAARVRVLPVTGTISPEQLAASIENILNFRAFRLLRIFTHGEVVGVKPCLNQSIRSLEYCAPIVDMLRRRQATPVLCDTTDRYRDISRTGINRMDELATKRSDLRTTPIVMLDGIKGDHEHLVRSADGRPDARIAGETASLGGAVIVSCAQPDRLAGVSGAVVNLGAGLASRRGKTEHYAMQPPQVHQDKCYACRRCMRYCPVGAIQMGKAHVVINTKRCVNCGRCVEVARYGGIAYEWDATPDYFREVITAHAKAAFDTLNHRAVFVTVVDLAPTADGIPRHAMLFARDPVAIDMAASELLAADKLLDPREQDRAHLMLNAVAATGLGQTQYTTEQVAF